MLAFATTASAQDDTGDPPFECDDRYAECGTPQQTGGGGCGCGGGGSILVNNTDLGETYQYADDYDDDGVEDPYDNCPWNTNPDQLDDDGDSIGSACDNCPNTANTDQMNLDGDAEGDNCDADMDGDGVANQADICAMNPDPMQRNTDGDSYGDACDADMDEDGIGNLEDNCPLVANPNQDNADPDTWGDACDDDDDGDGIRNTYDNCPNLSNYAQDNMDIDAFGDECDADVDGDELVNSVDNCPDVKNHDQLDSDRDLVGDACDDNYCFVVLGDTDNCLDPTNPFAVYSPMSQMQTGEETRLRLFSNRVNQPVRYTWQIVSAPQASKARIENPLGGATISTPYEYHYLADAPVTFTPDVAGTYELRVVADLVWEDVVTGEFDVSSDFVTTITVEGDPVRVNSGCNTSASPAYAGLFALPLVALALRRRRDA